jgi:tRNA acetyltransferase TAN1
VTEGEGNSNSVDTPVSAHEREAGAQAQASASEPPPASSEDDIEAEIAAEVRELNSPSRKYRFQSIQSGARNIVFIRTTIPEPSKLAHAILDDLFTTKQQKSRFLLRILPIDATCFTNLDEIRETARAILPKYFITGLFQSYQIVYKCRYSDKLSRDDVIKCIAEVAQEVNPLSVVDLTNPQLAIIVEIVKNVTCLGVARDFNKFRKYNLIEASGEVPPPAPANTAAAAGADGQEEGGKVEGDDGPGPEPTGEGMEQVSA